MDFFLWSHIKTWFYEYKLQKNDALKEEFRNKITEIDRDVYRRVSKTFMEGVYIDYRRQSSRINIQFECIYYLFTQLFYQKNCFFIQLLIN